MKIKAWKIIEDHLEPLPFAETLEDFNQVTKMLPGGAYTTFRSYGKTRVVCLQEHLDRLEVTAKLTNHHVSPPWPKVRQAMRKAVEEYPAEEIKGRVIMDLSRKPGDLYLMLEPLTIPTPEQYQNGISMVTRHLKRENPRAKQTNFIDRADEVRRTLPSDVFEAIMVDEDGQLLEGLTSNFFGVVDGALWTAEEGVLPGITRAHVIECARELGIPVHLKGVQEDELSSLSEAFITGTSRAVLPVTMINHQPVGDGKPGPISKKLLEVYMSRIDRIAEDI